MKGAFMCLLFSTIITLSIAAPNRLMAESIADNNVHIDQNDSICETPACVHEASFILKNMDSSVDPCENFYQFACGKFGEEVIIGDSVDTISVFSKTNEKIKEQLGLLISEKIEEDDQPIVKTMKSYYQTCMDTDQIEKSNINDLREVLKNLGGCPVLEGLSWDESNFDWKKSIYEANKMGYGTDIFFNMFIGVDPHNSTKLIINLDQASTEIPREYLINGVNDDLVKVYLKVMTGLIEFLGTDKKQAEKEVNDSIAFEMELAKISLPREERRDGFKLNNRMTIDQLETNYIGIPWTEYLNEILAPYVHLDRSEEVIVAVPSFLKNLPKLLEKTPKRVLANYLCIRTISESIDNMGKDFLTIKTEANKAISGIEKQEPRWKKCLGHVSTHFFVALSGLYVKHYFDQDAKSNAIYLTQNLRNSLYHLIEQANWMDRATKFAALEKINSLVSYVGYPDELDNDEMINEFYRNLTLYPGSFLRSEINLKKFKKKVRYSQLRKSADAIKWVDHSYVAEANAFYYLDGNSLDLPAGILQGHFYNNERPNYVNYGAIGQIIGHELSHALDDEGSQYDKNGNLLSWWKNETKEEYLNKAKCIIEQYGNYTVKEVNLKINGISTQGENIADNVGLKAAYFAYDEWEKNNTKEPRLPGLHYTPQQMFWISYANTWCRKIRPEKIKHLVLSGSHAISEFRVNGCVSNSHEFSNNFKCPLGSPMNPAKKCSVW